MSISKAISLGQIISHKHLYIQAVYIYIIGDINIPPLTMLKKNCIYFTGVIMSTHQKFYCLQNPLLPHFPRAPNFLCLSSQAILVLKSGMRKRIHTLYITSDEWAVLQHLSSYVKRNGITQEWYSSQSVHELSTLVPICEDKEHKRDEPSHNIFFI